MSAVLDRMVQAATLAPALQGNRIRISLSPAHLGDLLIELTLQGALLQGRVTTETEAARDAILSQFDQLRSRLERQGIRVRDFQVTVEGSEAGDRESERDAVPGPRSARRQLLDLLA